ncbi:MAG TPA: glycoside hydrolase family 99-like domain-containing protein [Anaerolineae bacterium]|nr:glycoside hydrolase family 99-like domain-containing protein [Anaerolineae bacterium]
MPIPTRPPTRRPRPTATTGQTVAGPTARPPATADGPGPTVTAITFPPGPLPAGGQLVLADYFAWFDDWDKCNVSAGDRPAEPYHSDDSNVIRRQVEQARNAGIDGFTLHWVGRGDRTDANFGRLLEASRGTAFRSTVVVEQHFFRGAKSVDEVAEALRYVMDTYGGHPSFLRYGDRRVLFFVDMDRIAGNNGNRAGAAAAWAEVRRRVDPRREAVWIAEGDNSAMPYLDVFDGLYTYRVVHKGMPLAYQKLPRYAQELRTKAKAVGRRLLWVATIMPGWDDLRSSCIGDVRVPAPLFKRDRENGAFYRSTFQTALSTAPDILYVNSFNEWVEGHYIEPSAAYGDLYMNLTREFASQYKRTN